jgi:hypothetical protein
MPRKPKEPKRPANALPWEKVADELRNHPGTWALVADDALSAYVSQIKNGRLTAFRPAGSFDARVRNGNGVRGNLYIRYTGGSTHGQRPGP